jgi:hypothetical protein
MEVGPVAIASSIDANVETKGKNEDHQQNEGHQRIRGQALVKIHKRSAACAFCKSRNATEDDLAALALDTKMNVETRFLRKLILREMNSWCTQLSETQTSYRKCRLRYWK